ncbi:ComEC/Rec2 family competence protein [Corynebacterium oculi]|uniref:Competence protein n=1 Tax=Corynebacterium oculi TaxID=1544416 RepID=A0A0Q1DXT4_9CORY|nr:ComEC/Rec2 family competence protein [Corynebacterium oculi]KQB85062.1 Competence protein [Corynebacterium oculi]
MNEVRLIPTAALVWAATLSVLLSREPAAWILVCAAVMTALALRSVGQALVVGTLGTVACLLTRLRWRLAHRALPEEIRAQVAGEPHTIGEQRWLVPVRVDNYPAQVPLFVESEHPVALSRGSPLIARVHWNPSERPGLGQWVGVVQDWRAGAPQGMAGWVARVHECFLMAVQERVGESSQGLIPGMVLGNTTAQDEAERELYVSTGLSHLSAVSGANVTIVATCVFLLCRLFTLGPRTQLAAAAAAVAAFFLLVGPDPSVLRATLTGLVGLLAVAHSATFPPLHGLSVAVIVLLLYDSSLAANWGFALSVAATAGIVILYPLLYRWIARARLPDILVRALAVSLAADLATTPLIAAMSGRVSAVSVLANVLVGPAVAPITLGGLLAVVALLLPGGGEAVMLWLIEPCAWWIHHVAQRCAALPFATAEATPAGVLVGYAWGVYLAYLMVLGRHDRGRRRGRKVLRALALCAVIVVLDALASGAWPGARPWRRAEPVDMTRLRVAVVDTEEEAIALSAGTASCETAGASHEPRVSPGSMATPGAREPCPQAIVVRDGSGRPAEYPTQTAEGIPVLFSERDGPVTLYRDGTQHAADGRF